ncbi:MAG: hypothetical protein IT537_30145 [Hyphomicrobiales bacterium]|nr:hypothetical protein [Hyphomicrobiales bacterium]
MLGLAKGSTQPARLRRRCACREWPRFARRRGGSAPHCAPLHPGYAAGVATNICLRTRITRWLRFGGDAPRVVERDDGAAAPAPGAALVALEGGAATDRLGLGARDRRGEGEPRLPYARQVDLRRRDGVRQGAQLRARRRAGDRACQRRGLLVAGGIIAELGAQAMAAGVLRRARLAGRGARPGAGAGVAAVGVRPPRTGRGGGGGGGGGDLGHGGVLAGASAACRERTARTGTMPALHYRRIVVNYKMRSFDAEG